MFSAGRNSAHRVSCGTGVSCRTPGVRSFCGWLDAAACLESQPTALSSQALLDARPAERQARSDPNQLI